MDSFFKKQGPYNLGFLLKSIKNNLNEKNMSSNIKNVASLDAAKKNEITFFDNVKYQNFLNKTEASFVLIKKEHLKLLHNQHITPIISKEPLIDFILLCKIFYPEADYDDNNINPGKKYNNFLERNVIIDESVEIGSNLQIGPNTCLKKNVIIGNNVKIGSNCSISNSIIADNVIINDGSVIGKIGFGFKFINGQRFFIPHIGCVIIEDSVYIGGNCTIDRGSFTNTVIGKGTLLDNQVHIAHNCKIGSNCFIAGQVGIAGSTILGNNCLVGGQAGISGHLKIGNNVYIGGGSGVLKNVDSKKKIMGYPAIDMRDFIKLRKNKKND